MQLPSSSQLSGHSNLRSGFCKLKHSFTSAKITDDTTKYYHVVAPLDQETSGRVLVTLSAPPADNKYTDLKQRLLTTFGLSKRERASKLLHLHPLGDRKPSELMDEMLFTLSLTMGSVSCLSSYFSSSYLKISVCSFQITISLTHGL